MLTLYGTWGCHLCEDAEALLQAADCVFVSVDIVDDPAAFALYRTEIPVLSADERILKWPFDAATLQAFLHSIRCEREE
jgi:hypothetical protein